MNLAVLDRLKLIVLTAGVCLAISLCPATAAPYKSNQIRVEYVPPKNPAHQPIYERLKQVRALERLQTLLSPFDSRIHCFSRFLVATAVECLVRGRLRDRLLRIPGRPTEKCVRANSAERNYTRRCHTWPLYGRVLA